jgi:hypothetical protein
MTQKTLWLSALAALFVIASGTAAIGLTATSVTVNVTGMSPHLQDLFEARLVDAASGVEISRMRIPVLTSTSFELTLPGAVEGRSYYVDMYADDNGSGGYDGPPIDHAWRLVVTATAESQSIDFAHNTEFDAIEWPETGDTEVGIDGAVAEDEYPNMLEDPGTGMTVYWRNDALRLAMALIAPGSGWVSAGLDPEVAMQGANYILAAVTEAGVIVEDHFGSGRFSHSVDDQQDILGAAGQEADGETIVEFVILLDSGDPEDKVLLSGERYDLLLAFHASSDSLTARHTDRGSVQIELEQD